MKDGSIHARIRRQVDQLFVEGLSPPRHRALRDHLRDCDACRAHYERLRQVEERLFTDGEGLSVAAQERLADLVVQPKGPAPARSAWPTLGLALAALSAILLAVVLVPQGKDQRAPDEDFMARGTQGTAQGGLNVFHVDPEHRAVTRMTRVPEGAPIESGSVMQLAYSNTDFAHLVVVGLDAHYELHWYHPGSSAGDTRIERDVTDMLLGDAWQITAPAGGLRLFAVFSNEPLDASTIEAAAAHVSGAQLPLTQVAELPGLGLHQDSVLLKVEP